MAINLSSIKRGRTLKPPRIIVYGDHKIGKSEFAASAPNPIFADIERGLDHIDTSKEPIDSYPKLIELMSALLTQDHGFETFVTDSLDWLERLIFAHVCALGGKQNIEDFGYGKGYIAALTFWNEYIEGLNALRDQKGMAIICLAHYSIKRFDAPDTESYDQYRIKLHERSAGLMQEWADIIGFAAKETVVKKSEVGQTEIKRGIGTGRHLLHMVGQPSFCAGNRYNLPKSVELRWPAFLDAFNKAAALTFTPPVEQPAQAAQVAEAA